MSAVSGLVDAHAHLCDPLFDKDRYEVLACARQAGVAAVVGVGETLADARKNIRLSAIHPMIKPAAGLYPTILDPKLTADMIAFIRDHCHLLVAIGEVGLDFWQVKKAHQQEVQREQFRAFIDLSKTLRLPLSVHSRSAGRHAVTMLLEHGAKRVQLHAFDGRAATALPAVEAGFFFSIPPSIVRSRQKQKLVRQLPLQCLLVETDSPVLGPAPGERNEPANLFVAVRAIARIKDLPEQAVTEALLENTFRLYGDLECRRPRPAGGPQPT